MNWPKISLVTPSFEQAPYLEQTMRSVLEQGYPNLEYIVMDGGSKDGSVDVIRRFESRLAYWQSRPDDGQYAAVLEGFKRSTGDILGWINSDDLLLPHSLQTVASIFLNHPRTEWITGLPTVIDESGTATVYDDTPLWCRGLFLHKQYKFIQQESTFWRRSLWEKAGATLRTESALAGDLELWVRFFRHAVLHSVRYLFGAFRRQPDQKTASRLEAYCAESEDILDKELEFFEQSGSPFLLPAPPRLLLGSSDLRPLPSDKPLEALCNELFEAIETNDFNRAAALANGVSSAMPESFAALQLQAVCESFRGNSINAEAIIKNASFRFPGDPPADGMVRVPQFLQRCIEKAVQSVAPVPLKSEAPVLDENSLDLTGDKVSLPAERDSTSPTRKFGTIEAGRSDTLLVSAIVSTFNSESLIGPCLDDLVNQSLFQSDRLEVIVIDSGSQQNERDVVRSYQGRFGNISYERTERENIYAAWNRAIRIARGRYVTNANTDDSHRTDALEKLAATLDANGDADLAYGDFINTSIPNDTFANPRIIREARLPSYQPATAMFYCVTGCHPMWRRSVFRKIGLFDPQYPSVGDYEFLLRFVKGGLCAVHVPEVLSLFCENPQGIQFKSAVRNYMQFENVRNQYRAVMPIERLFSIDTENRESMAFAWIALGLMAMEHEIPWFEKPCEDFDYAEFCFNAALALDPANEAALNNLVFLKDRQGKTDDCTELLGRLLPKSAVRLAASLKQGDLVLVPVVARPAGQPGGTGRSAPAVRGGAPVGQGASFTPVTSGVWPAPEAGGEKKSGLHGVSPHREETGSGEEAAAAEQGRVTEVSGTDDSTRDGGEFLVSAIVSTYNSERFFRGCLEDLIGQTLYQQRRLEIVVVDSGSEQGEREIVKQFQERYPNFVYQRTDRETLYAAWNRGVRIARGRYLTAANTDDRHRPDALETMARVLDETEVGLVYSDVMVTTVANETFDRSSAQSVWQLPDYSLRQALVHCPYGAKYMWPRALHDEVGLFDGYYTSAGDYEFFLRLSKRFGAFRIHQALGLYFESLQNISYRDQNTVVREVNRFLAGQRRATPLDDVYPFLQEEDSNMAQAAALVDWANQMAWSSVFPDLEYSEELYRNAERLHQPFIPGIRNNLALIRYRQGQKAEALKFLEEVAPLFDAARHNLSEIKSGRSDPNLRMFSGPHPAIQAMPPVVTPQGRRVVVPDYKASELNLSDIISNAAKARKPKVRSRPLDDRSELSRSPAHSESDGPARLSGEPAQTAVRKFGESAGLSVAWLAPVFTPSGYAEEARSFIVRLEKRGFNMAVRSLTAPSEVFREQMDPKERAHFDELLLKRLPHPIATVIHGPAYILRPNPDTEYSIGRTMFEAEGLPVDWVSNCNAMDEIWVPTRGAIDSFKRAGVTSRLVWIPGGIDAQHFRPSLKPLPIPGKRGTVFLSVFEWIFRKGWDVLLEAWVKAFRRDDDVCLVLKTYPMNTPEGSDVRMVIEGRIDNFLRERFGITRGKTAPIIVLSEQIPEEKLPRLFASATAYVAPSRGEGWGRPQMAAMASGIPTIATRWGGTQEFMTPENSLLIDYQMALADERCEIPFYKGFSWANPSSEHLAQLLRWVPEHLSEAAAIGARARKDIEENWQWDRVADFAATRLEEIRKNLVPGRATVAGTAETSAAKDVDSGDKEARLVAAGGEAPVMSVLVSAYNSERFMRGCLEDLVSQTLFEKGLLEIIVVDSGSQQNERRIVQEFQKKCRNIRYVRTESRETVYRAWNRALEVAAGRYLTNGNTDDRHRPDALELMAGVMDRYREFDLLYADSLITNSPNETFTSASTDKRYDWPDFNLGTALSNFIFGPHPVWRRSLHEEIGMFDPNLSVVGDYEFFLRAAWKRGAAHLRETLGLFYQHSDTVSGRANARKTVDETMGILRRLREAIPIADIYSGLSGLKPSDPGFAAAWFDFGNLCALSPYNDFNLALGSYEKALRISKETPGLQEFLLSKIHNNSGVIFFCAGDANRARDCFAKCGDLASAHSNGRLMERFAREQKRGFPIQFAIEEWTHPIVAASRRTRGLVLTETREVSWGDEHDQVFWDVYTGTNGIPVSAEELERARARKPRHGTDESRKSPSSSVAGEVVSEVRHQSVTGKAKLRVLFTMFGWNETGGGTLFPKSVAEELARRGNEVSVFYAAINHPSSQVPYLLEETVSPEGVRLFGLYNRPAPFVDPDNPERETLDPEIVRCFGRVVERCFPDVVHFHNFHGLTLAIAAEAKRRGLPTVYTPHNYHLIDPTLYLYRSDLSLWSGTDFFSNSELVSRHPQKRDGFARRIQAAKAMLTDHLDLTLAISTRVRDLLSDFCGSSNRIAVVHQVPRSTEELLSAEPVYRKKTGLLRIGFLGGVLPHKGVHILAAAAQQLPAGMAEVNLFGFASKSYQARLNEIDRNKVLRWRGAYEAKDLPRISRETDVVVTPSVWEEGAGLVILEALAMKCPVIASRIGGIPDFVVDGVNGRLYRHDSVVELAQILEGFIHDRCAVEILAQNCRLPYRFGDYVDHVVSIYHRLAAGETFGVEEASLVFGDWPSGRSSPRGQPGKKHEHSTTGIAASMDESLDQLILLAARELQSGNLKAARAALARIIEISPEDLDALVSLGSVLYRMEEFEEAREYFRRALAIKRDDPSLYVQSALASLKANRIADFEAAVERALELDPNCTAALKVLGDLNLQEGRYKDAGQSYARILSRDPANVEVLLALGVCFFKGGDLAMARSVFEKALEYSPDHLLAKENLSVIRKKLSESTSGNNASEWRPEPVELDSSFRNQVQRLVEQAEGAYESGDLSSAKELLLKAYGQSPNELAVLSSLAAVFDALGDGTSARRYLEEALRVKGEDADLYLQLALIELKRDEIESFERMLAKALEVDPAHKASLKLLADLSFKNDQLKDAAEIYTKILKHFPDELEALLPLGTCFLRDGDIETAKLVFERALQADPECAVAKENLESIRPSAGRELPKGGTAKSEPASPEEIPAAGSRTVQAEATSVKKKELGARLQELVDEANFFSEVGNHEASLEALERALELAPRDTRILSAVGSLHFTMGNFDASREKFRRVIELKPRSAEAYTRLAMACLRLDRIEEMESALGIALEIDPKDREALKFLAKTNLESERVRDAGRTYAKLLEEQPDDGESMLALGLCFFKGGDLSAARMVYNRVLEFDPDNATAHENLSRIEERTNQKESSAVRKSDVRGRQGDRSSKINRFLTAAEEAFGSQNLAAARDALKSALELSSDAPEILAALGSLHFQLGEMAEARDVLKRLVERAPADAGKWVQLALAHFQLKEIEEFEAALAKALDLDPDHLEALRLLAHLSFNHGNIIDAAQTYGRILKQTPDDLEVVIALGVCFFKTGDHETAKMMFERALELDPGNALAGENLAVVISKIKGGQSATAPAAISAAADSERSLDIAGDTGKSGDPASSADVDALLVEADQVAAEGDVRKACELLRKALELEPNTHEIAAALGSLLYQLGDWEGSYETLARAVELAPNSADYHTRLAISLLSLERIADFEAALAKALEIDANCKPALRLLADLNFRQGGFIDAAHTYHRLLLQAPDDVDVMLPLAVCFYKNGDPEAAKMVFDRILTLDPNNTVARENRTVLDQRAAPGSTERVQEGVATKEMPPPHQAENQGKTLSVVWEGSQFVHHSLALINRELCLGLMGLGHDISVLPYEPDQFGPEVDPRFEMLARSVRSVLLRPANAHIRHQWPFNPDPPKEGRWIVIQPWEYGRAPKDWIPVFRDKVDEIWVPSSWVRSCYIESGVPAEKVFVVPNGVNPKMFHPGAPPIRLSTKKKFKFLFVGGLIRRKGADILLNAYLERFSATDDVCLVIKSFGSEIYRDDKVRARIREIQNTSGKPEILLLDQDMPPADLPGLYTACDCLVHPYRGEGFGLPILEAMACGLSTIVTGGGASDDFATDAVAYKISAIRKNLGMKILDLDLAGEGWLLEPDQNSLEERMGWVFSHVDEAKALGRRASKHALDGWTWDSAVAKAEQRLVELSSNPEPPVRFKSTQNKPIEERKNVPSATDGGNSEISRSDKGLPGGENARVSGSAVPVVWEGPQFSHHSLALINRELCLSLIGNGAELSIKTIGAEAFGVEMDSRFQELKDRLDAGLSGSAGAHIRHQWPLNTIPPKEGFWIVMQPWEYGAIPKEWIEPLRNSVDEIWAYTNFVRETYIRCGIPSDKIFVIPCGIHPEKFNPNVPKAVLPTKKAFKFLFVGGTILRKGPDLLLESFLRLFSASDDVCLVIKDFGGKEVYKGQTIERAIREAQARKDAPEILYLTDDLPPEELPGLYAACDCLVHPYRGEGFALPVLEAMAVGLPVIVTSGGSTDDFALDGYAYRIPSKRADVPNWAGPELVDPPTWLEPDTAALDERMLFVERNRGAARKIGRAASVYVRENWTWERAADKVRKRLADLSGRSEKPLRFRSEIPVPLPVGGDIEITVPAAGRIGSLEAVHEFVNRKKYSKAWNAALEAIRLRSFHPDAYMQMVDIALRAEDDRQAFVCAERLVKMTPNWKMAQQIYSSLKNDRNRRKSKIKWTPLPKEAKTPRLSVCLIVKDEEEHIGRCLASVKNIAGQIVVVDTGSSDKTVDIAKEHGAEVYHFEWNDNFSDARNKGHEYARGDWVLILDADEELSADSHQKILDDMSAENILGYRIPICNLHESEDSVTYVPRLFRNAPALFFVGRVHEQIYASVIARKSDWGMDAVLGTARIVHHGYDPGLVKRRQKVRRNLRLLERAIEEMPNEAALIMNYGLDLVNDGRLEEGLVQYRKAFKVMEPHPAAAILPEVRERLLTIFGVHLLRAERFDEVVDVMTSRLARDCGPTASIHFLAAAALMKLGRPGEAISQLKDCLVKRSESTLTPPCPQIFKGGPRHLLAECFCKLAQFSDAETEFKEALKESPDSAGILHDFAYFLHQRERSLEALQVLHGVLGKGVDELRIWHLGSLIANCRPEFVEFALDWTAEAIKFCPEHAGIGLARGEALLKSGRLKEAVPYFRKEPHATEASALAAVILAELAEGNPVPSVAAAEEPNVSREFIAWYRRLLATKAQTTLLTINSKVDLLQRVLPTASQMLKQALNEAES
ncbi:MAG: glycosyltransferase [Verrucomicrobia bacterium]|nr:glycosyltransferase [Verrucomicrobiota bacterium]